MSPQTFPVERCLSSLVLSWQEWLHWPTIIVGRGGHVSRPDKSVNPVFAAADVLTSISVAWNNQRDLEKLVTLGVTQLEGGKVYNVIPNEVFIGGSLRFFDDEAGKHALNLVKNVSEHVAAAHGCTVSYTDRMKVDLPPVTNDTTYTTYAQQQIEALYPGRVTDDGYQQYAANHVGKDRRIDSLYPSVTR